MKKKPCDLSRRRFTAAILVAAPALGAGCAAVDKGVRGPTGEKSFLTEGERRLIEDPAATFEIVTRGGPRAEVLRKTTRAVPAGLDLTPVAKKMEATMLEAKGVGLAGPQVGLSLRACTLQLDYKTDNPRILFARNPVIVERSDETTEGYEGCLSIPGVGGLVRRNTWIRVRHETQKGEFLYSEAEGANAVLWQHELDHLGGELYVDRVLGALLPMEEVRRLRRLLESKTPPEEATDPSRSSQLHLEGAILPC